MRRIEAEKESTKRPDAVSAGNTSLSVDNAGVLDLEGSGSRGEELVVRQAVGPRGVQGPPALANSNTQSACCIVM